ncbi:MAG: phosphoenolpyruvate--protein phosphotransferase [Egibacteraceae bacterium]
MNRLEGIAASPGAGVAPARIYVTEQPELPSDKVDDADAEASRLEGAMQEVADDLNQRAEDAGGEAEDILSAQAMMAQDPDLEEKALTAVRDEGKPAARAVVEAGETYAKMLENSDNEYMAARAGDVRDVCARIARRLLGVPEPDLGALDEPVVVVARDLMPADTAVLDPEFVQGIVTAEGSRTSHTAILARALGVPAVVAVDGLLDAATEGTPIGIDGDEGAVFVDPDEQTREELADRAERAEEREAELREQAGEGPAATADDHRVELAANAANAAELQAAVDSGAEGVGLLRTEFLYLSGSEAPTQEEQVETFREMAQMLGEGRMVVRTFDFGADKPVSFLDMGDEENPALGVRGIRLARQHPDLLDAQLAALVQVADVGPTIAVMAPMVTTVADAEWLIERFEEAGGREADMEIGAMVEVPSAVYLAGELAERLDFLSVGTNDLAQYLHAADRQHGAVSELQDPFGPAVLRAMKMICDAADGKAWVGVCGEAGGDPLWGLVAVGLGVSELSMGAGSLLEVKAKLRSHDLATCQAAAEAALAEPDAERARAAAQDVLA